MTGVGDRQESMSIVNWIELVKRVFGGITPHRDNLETERKLGPETTLTVGLGETIRGEVKEGEPRTDEAPDAPHIAVSEQGMDSGVNLPVLRVPILFEIKRGVIAELRNNHRRYKIVIVSSRIVPSSHVSRRYGAEIKAMVAEGPYIGKMGSITALTSLLGKRGSPTTMYFDPNRLEPLGEPLLSKMIASRDTQCVGESRSVADISAERLEEYKGLIPNLEYDFSVDKFGFRSEERAGDEEFGKNEKGRKERIDWDVSLISIGTIGAFFPNNRNPCLFAVSWKSEDNRLEIMIIKGGYIGVTGRASAVGALVHGNGGHNRIHFDPNRLEPAAASLVSTIEAGGDSRRIVLRNQEACLGSSVCSERPDILNKYRNMIPDVGRHNFSALYSYKSRGIKTDKVVHAAPAPAPAPAVPMITQRDTTLVVGAILRGCANGKLSRDTADKLMFKLGQTESGVEPGRNHCRLGEKSTGIQSTSGGIHRPFEQARDFVRSLGLKDVIGWCDYCKSGKKPADIPSEPDRVYQNKGYISLGNWLGTEYRPFEQARDFVHSLGLKSAMEWYAYCKSGKKPANIPSNPDRVYKGWISHIDWLGNHRLTEFRPFEQARDFVHSLGLKNHYEWRDYCKSGKRPADIPGDPNRIYWDKGWISYGDWMGTGNVASYRREFRPFEQARDSVHSLGLKDVIEWRGYCTSGKKPADIPSNPNLAYRGKGWISYTDWLGTEYRPFEQARDFVRSLGLKDVIGWRGYCKSGKKPADIPSNPNLVYEDEGWISCGDWLGSL